MQTIRTCSCPLLQVNSRHMNGSAPDIQAADMVRIMGVGRVSASTAADAATSA